jgi:hypothetical protein
VAVAALLAGFVTAASSSAAADSTAAAGRQPAQTVYDDERIEFAPGTDNATREGDVDVGNVDRWTLRANAGQTMQLVVDSPDDNTVFTVFAPDRSVLGTVVPNEVDAQPFWSGVLPATGDYQVEITSLGGPAYYAMKVWIDAQFVEPLGLVQRLSFAPGTVSGTATGAAIRASTDQWFLGARAGQTMEVAVTSLEGNSTFDVFAPDGSALTAPGERTTWSGVLPADGDYVVAIQPTRGNTTYTLTVRITPGTGGSTGGGSSGGGSSAGAVTRRLSFAPGTDNGVVFDSIAPGQPHRWIVGAAAGQVMAVFIESDTGDIGADIISPSGVPLASFQFEVGIDLVEDGDYVVEVNNLAGIVGAYTLTVYIT